MSSSQPSLGPTPAQAPAKPSNIVLIGLSGSGKSTVARLLARRLGWRCVDTDHEIQRRTGLRVEQIFREQGEAGFRALESRVVHETCERAHQVVATGGGAVLDAANRARLLDGNLVIWLESSPAVLAERLARNVAREPRPLLAGSPLLDRLSELRREREPHYLCAHHVVQTDERTPREVVDAIVDLIRSRR